MAASAQSLARSVSTAEFESLLCSAEYLFDLCISVDNGREFGIGVVLSMFALFMENCTGSWQFVHVVITGELFRPRNLILSLSPYSW
jgi:hypothetical protein